MATPAFDWSGMYFGVYGGWISLGAGQAGAQVGFNMQRGSFVAGLELEAGAIFAGGAFSYEVEADARLGFVLGERFLLYGLAGVGFFGTAGAYWAAGGGAEIAIRDALSVFAEGKAIGAFGGGGIAGYIVQGGLNWHR
jgi:hypothetical protein